MEKTLGRFGVVLGLKPDTGSFKKVQDASKKTADGLGKLKTLAAGLFGGFAVSRVISGFTNMNREMDRIAKSAKAFALSTDDLQAFEFAAKRSGLSIEQLGMAMRGIPKRLSAAASGSKEAQNLFSQLGLSVDAMFQQSPADQFRELAGALSKIENPTKQAGFAFKLFEESGQKLLPLFASGKKGLAALEAEFKKLGGGYSKEELANAEAFTDELENMRVAAIKMFAPIRKLIPVVTGLMRKFGEFTNTKTFDRWVRAIGIGLGVLSTAFALFGAKALAANLPLILAFAGLATTVGLVGLAIDEMIQYVKGGKTVFGELLDFLDSAAEKTGIWATGAKVVAESLKFIFGGAGESTAAILETFETPHKLAKKYGIKEAQKLMNERPQEKLEPPPKWYEDPKVKALRLEEPTSRTNNVTNNNNVNVTVKSVATPAQAREAAGVISKTVNNLNKSGIANQHALDTLVPGAAQ